MNADREFPRLLTIPEASEAAGINVRSLVYGDPDFAESCVVRLGRRVRIRKDALREFIEARTGAPPVEYTYTRKPGRPSRAELEAAG